MKVTISFLHFDHTPAIDEKIKNVSAKMSKFFNDEGSIKWACYKRNNEHVAEVNFIAPHQEYHAKSSSRNMFESIDKTLDKIEKQALKVKDRMNKLHRGSSIESVINGY
jgi:putative sigma-54 modulation protein